MDHGRRPHLCSIRTALWLISAVTCVALATNTAFASILPQLSGHHRAALEANTNADASLSFAVFTRDGPLNDVFGTGFAEFDNRFIAGSASATQLDTSAKYLYLYQYINDGPGSDPILGLGIDAQNLTSWGHWELGLRDIHGPVAVGNPLGVNSTNFSLAAPAVLGVQQGAVDATLSAQTDRLPTSVSYNGVALGVGFNLEAGNRLSVFGFTSNLPPVVRNFTLEECPDNRVCGGFVSPPPRPPETFVEVSPRATYLRAADELSPGPAPAEIIELASVLSDGPITAGDWILLQRVGDFRASQAPCAFSGTCGEDFPVNHPERPSTLRNMFGVFSGSDQLRPDPEALRGANKSMPIPDTDLEFSRVTDAIPVTEGNALPINTDTTRFPHGYVGDPFNNDTMFQLTDIDEDFVINLGMSQGGSVESPEPVLVRVPAGATHLFISAGDGQFFDNTLTGSADLPNGPDGQPVGKFGLRIAKLSAGRLVGDYNLDGLIDAADYVVWRRQLGRPGLTLMADGNADGIVTDADFQVWQPNFGRSVSSLLTATSQVPEPTSVGLLFYLMGVLLLTPSCRTIGQRLEAASRPDWPLRRLFRADC